MTPGCWQEFDLRWSAGAAAARVPSAWRHRRRGLPLLVLLPWLAAAVRVSPAVTAPVFSAATAPVSLVAAPPALAADASPHRAATLVAVAAPTDKSPHGAATLVAVGRIGPAISVGAWGFRSHMSWCGGPPTR